MAYLGSASYMRLLILQLNFYVSGHFLYTYIKEQGPRELHIWSTTYGKPSDQCRLSFWHHMHNMSDGSMKIIINSANNTQSIVSEKKGNDLKK